MEEIPNFDAMDREDLQEFLRRDEKAACRALFNGRPKALQVLRAMRRYAKNRISAISMRESGSIQDAIVYESICGQIYSELPEWAQW